MANERKRLDYLRKTYLPRLEANANLRDIWHISADAVFCESVFHELSESDPSEKKVYLERLLNWTLTGQLSPEDLQGIKHALSVFDKTKQSLPEQQRDINSFGLRHAFMAAVDGSVFDNLNELISEHEDEWSRLEGFPLDGSADDKVGFARHTVLNNDPSKGKYSGDIIRWMSNYNERLLPEDLPRIHDYLALHIKNNNKIPIERRPVSGYAGWKDLRLAIGPYMKKKSLLVSELRHAEEQALADTGAMLIYEGKDWRLMRINTEQAAILLGAGTEWCTAFTNGRTNYFKDYNDDLLYLRFNDGRRYQLHFRTMHIRDENDFTCYELLDVIHDDPELLRALGPYDRCEDFIPAALYSIAGTNSGKAGWKMETVLTMCSRFPKWSRIVAKEIAGVHKAARHNEDVKVIIEDACYNHAKQGWSLASYRALFGWLLNR